MPIVVCHAGSASNPAHADGSRLACLDGLGIISNHEGALEAAVAATRRLEDDERFNAGTGVEAPLKPSIGLSVRLPTAWMSES